MPINRRDFLRHSAALLGTAAAAAATPRQEPPPAYNAPGVTIYSEPRDYSDDLRRYLQRLMAEARRRRQLALAGIETREKMIERQAYVRSKLWELLGGPFEKTPLHAKVAGSLKRDGYRVDRLIYESRPGLFVTSNLYVPTGRGPFPAVLSPLGHSGNGKAWASYQTLFQTLARKGYIVLAFDPFGQGERIEYPDEAGRSRLGPTGEHDYAGKRLLLWGINFALFRAWDGIRGLDYLLSRDDVDPARLGCGGQSGGGTMTMYLAALDGRIQAAVVSEGNTENVAQEGFEPPGAVDDAEQNIVPALLYGLDRFDLLHAFAPKPLLLTMSNKDAGTTYGPEYLHDGVMLLDELKRTYRLFGAEDRVSLAETPMRHGYTYEHRRATYGWYNRWLSRPQEDDREAPVAAEPDKYLWCTATGLAVTSLKGETSFTLTRKLAEQPKPAGRPTSETIREMLGLSSAGSAEGRGSVGAGGQVLSVTTKYDHVIEEIELVSEREIHLPSWLVRPLESGARKAPAVLMVSDASKDGFIAEGQMAGEFSRAGVLFCTADVRGRGQCTPRPPSLGPRYYFNRGEDFYVWDTLVLGRPMLGGYVRDALETARWLRSRPEVDPARVWVIGHGTMGLVALFTLALDESLRGGVVESALSDYRSIIENDQYTTPFRAFLPGVLKRFDLPDVAAAIAPRPLLLLNPVDQAGRPMEAGRARAFYSAATVRVAETVTAATYLNWIQQFAPASLSLALPSRSSDPPVPSSPSRGSLPDLRVSGG